jgi:hypothetical protein
MNPKYIALRLIRHLPPASLTHFLLRHNWIIQAGSETNTPQLAIERYQQALTQVGQTLGGKRVMVFGYGDNFAVGCGLLRTGVTHVVLCDKYARPDNRRNQQLLPEYGDYLVESNGHVLPRPEVISVFIADIRQLAIRGGPPPVDMVLSTHVYEHLDDVDGITQALAALTSPGGLHLHFIDLRDHFFKYPFEMLTFSERAWRDWLNPGSNLNRCRLHDYRQIFQKYFKAVNITMLERDQSSLELIRHRIRPEFLTGDIESDAATQIQVMAYV